MLFFFLFSNNIQQCNFDDIYIVGKEVVNSTLSPTTFRVQQKQDVKYICEKDGFIRTPSEQPGRSPL